jgi:hypothetical protein
MSAVVLVGGMDFRTLLNCLARSRQARDFMENDLDRRPKAKLEAKEATGKSWKMWFVFGVGVINIINSIVLTFLSKSGQTLAK